jgi:hypothetical protein
VTAFILDNSVTMRWCFDAGTHEYADNILRLLTSGKGSAFVPVLWRYEVSAVLARALIAVPGNNKKDTTESLSCKNILQ